MKRLLVVLGCLGLASHAFAEKSRRFPAHVASPTAPATVTITGNPLTIVVGGDTSMQVYNSNVPGTGQFFPPDCSPGETADSGVFVGTGGLVYGPDFPSHPCGSASNTYTAWTPVSLSPVTGTGANGDPFTVTIVVNAGLAVQMTETLTYTNGSPTVNIALAFANIVGTEPQGGITLNAFIGADLFLADNDEGFPVLQGNNVGGRGADANCVQLQYVILFLGNTAPNAHAGEGFGTIWDEISAGALTNTVDNVCEDNGAALEWTGLALPSTISTGVSFTGSATPLASNVPTLSMKGLGAFVILLAVVGYVLSRKMSLGA